MDPQVTHSLFTFAAAVSIVILCVGTLLALPWSIAAQESTERGLLLGATRLAAIVDRAIRGSGGGPAPSVAVARSPRVQWSTVRRSA